MTSDKDKSRDKGQRRVYVLPTELVERIVAFQEEKKYSSEVEAVRKLLDEALLHRDTAETIVTRFRDRLRALRMPTEIARDVLVGHPLVSNISFGKHSITFSLSGSHEFQIHEDGSVDRRGEYDQVWEAWKPPFTDLSRKIDDDIPF